MADVDEGSQAVELIAGGIYSFESGGGEFGLARLLAVDEEAAHVRLYKDKFSYRPGEREVRVLRLGGGADGGAAISIGHLPLRLELFLAWEPELVSVRSVTEEELRGYRLWREAGGGLW